LLVVGCLLFVKRQQLKDPYPENPYPKNPYPPTKESLPTNN